MKPSCLAIAPWAKIKNDSLVLKLFWILIFLSYPGTQAVQAGDIWDGYIKVGDVWLNVGGANNAQYASYGNSIDNGAHDSNRSSASSYSFGIKTYNSFAINAFTIFGWTSHGETASNSGANYRVWKSGDTEPSSYSNYYGNVGPNYAFGSSDFVSTAAQDTQLIGDTFINGATYNLRFEVYTNINGVKKHYSNANSATFSVAGAREEVTISSGSSSQSTAYNTSAAGGVVKKGAGTLVLTKDGSNASTGQKGQIYIDAGTVSINPDDGVTADQAIGGSSAIVNVGPEGSSGTAGFSLAPTGGGLTVNRNVVIRSGGGTRTLSAANTSGTHTIAGGVTLNSAANIDAASGGTFIISGVISGGNGFTKTGGGSLTLSGSTANTFSAGTVTVSAGTLILNKSPNTSAIAGRPVDIASNATLRTDAAGQIGSAPLVTVTGTFDLNGNSQTVGLAGGGSVNLDGSAASGTLTISNSGTDTFSGTISDNGRADGAVTKAGTGTQILTGNNAYDGTTTVSAGVLRIGHANALGSATGATTVSSGAALEFSNATTMTISEALTINGTGVGGSGGAIKNAQGNNYQTGAVTLNSSSRIAATSGNLVLQGGVAGGSNVLYLGTAGGNVSIDSVISGSGATQDGTITSLFKDGTGTLTLTGANTYSGDTRITQGTLTVDSGGSLGNGTSDVFISSNATLNVNTSTTVDSVRETATSNGGVVAIGSGATLTVTGQDKGLHYQNSISGEGNLTMNGSGTTTLGLYGTQSYTGNTTVSGGKLTSGVQMATAGVTVSGGTFETTADNILSSSSKNVTVNSGTYDVKGSDSIGALSGTGGTTAIASGKTLTANYGSNASYGGAILGAGTFRKSGASTLTLASGASASVSTIAIQQGTLLLGAANQIADGTAITMSGGTLNTDGYGDAVGKLTVNAASTIKGLAATGAGSDFTFSNIDLGNYATSSGSTLTFLNAGGTSYGLGTVIQLSTVAASSWSSYSETSLNNFRQKISFSDDNLRAQINFGDGISGTTLTVAAIPEPRVYAAAAVLTMLIGYAEYRRRRPRIVDRS